MLPDRDISTRGGGSISSKIVPAITGYSSNNFLLQRALGNKLTSPTNTVYSPPKSYVIMRFFPEIIGRVNNICLGMPENSKIIHSEFPKYPVESRKISNSRDRLGYWVIAAEKADFAVDDERAMVDSIEVQ